MLISDLKIIGSRLRTYRKKLNMTQSEVAEAAILSDRAYADIERGISNPRLETFLNICKVLQITPDEILIDTSDTNIFNLQDDVLSALSSCSSQERQTALQLLSIYLNSLN